MLKFIGLQNNTDDIVIGRNFVERFRPSVASLFVCDAERLLIVSDMPNSCREGSLPD
jgi:hypothetical protein